MLMSLLHQILFNLAIAAIADPFLARISDSQLLSIDMIAPRYLKYCTSSSCCWFIMIFALLATVVWIIILLYSELISIQYALALSAS